MESIWFEDDRRITGDAVGWRMRYVVAVPVVPIHSKPIFQRKINTNTSTSSTLVNNKNIFNFILPLGTSPPGSWWLFPNKTFYDFFTSWMNHECWRDKTEWRPLTVSLNHEDFTSCGGLKKMLSATSREYPLPYIICILVVAVIQVYIYEWSFEYIYMRERNWTIHIGVGIIAFWKKESSPFTNGRWRTLLQNKYIIYTIHLDIYELTHKQRDKPRIF